MGSFEMPSDPDQARDKAREEAVTKVMRYFEESSEEGDVYGDGTEVELDPEDRERLENIIADMENNDFSSAYDYLDEEVKYYEKKIQIPPSDTHLADELRSSLEKVTALRDSLIIQE